MEFEWDAAKELASIKKHGVPFADAVEFYWFGKTNKGRVLTTWFTRRGKVVRIIGSAEWRKFRRLYYETTENE